MIDGGDDVRVGDELLLMRFDQVYVRLCVQEIERGGYKARVVEASEHARLGTWEVGQTSYLVSDTTDDVRVVKLAPRSVPTARWERSVLESLPDVKPHVAPARRPKKKVRDKNDPFAMLYDIGDELIYLQDGKEFYKLQVLDIKGLTYGGVIFEVSEEASRLVRKMNVGDPIRVAEGDHLRKAPVVIPRYLRDGVV